MLAKRLKMDEIWLCKNPLLRTLTLKVEYCMSARTQSPNPVSNVDLSQSSAWLREAIEVLLANTVRMNLPGRKVSRTRLIICKLILV